MRQLAGFNTSREANGSGSGIGRYIPPGPVTPSAVLVEVTVVATLVDDWTQLEHEGIGMESELDGSRLIVKLLLLIEAVGLVGATALMGIIIVVGAAVVDVCGAGAGRVIVVNIVARVMSKERVIVVVVVTPNVVVEVSVVLKPVGALVIETDVEQDSIQIVVFEEIHVETSHGYSITVKTWQTSCVVCRRNMSGKKLNALIVEAWKGRIRKRRIVVNVGRESRLRSCAHRSGTWKRLVMIDSK